MEKEETIINNILKRLKSKIDNFNLKDVRIQEERITHEDSGEVFRTDLEIVKDNNIIAVFELKAKLFNIDNKEELSSFQLLANAAYSKNPNCSFYFVTNGKDAILIGKKTGKALMMDFDEALDEIVKKCIELSKDDQRNRMIAGDSISQKLDDLVKKRDRLQKKLVEAKLSKANEQDASHIQALENSVSELNSQIAKLQSTNDIHEEGQEVENKWNKRIVDAFTILTEKTKSIETQKYISRGEWIGWNSLIVISLVFFTIWTFWFINHVGVSNLEIKNYYTLFPKIMPLPIFIGLLWLFVVQKNKARRIEIEISDKLFKIKYLEGLLMMINKLSKNNDLAVDHINILLEDIIHEYVVQIGKTDISDDKIKKISTEEEDSNPMIKNVSAIKKLVSNGK